jgi:hypothetical protein
MPRNGVYLFATDTRFFRRTVCLPVPFYLIYCVCFPCSGRMLTSRIYLLRPCLVFIPVINQVIGKCLLLPFRLVLRVALL